MKGAALLEKLLNRPGKLARFAVDNLLRTAIPFNAPHGFYFKKIDAHEVQIGLPNFPLNHNHLGGMHACAIATLGEFCAGMTLVKNLGFRKYRFILSELRVKYHLQGRTSLTGIATLTAEEIARIKTELETQEKILYPHTTRIFNAHGELVAEVESVWQLKSWDKVQLR